MTMNFLVSLLVVACLLGSNAPAFAQFNALANGGPISRSALRDAERLGMLDAQPGTHDGAWAAVRRIKPGTRLTVTTAKMSGEQMYFLSADEASLTVLKPTIDLRPSDRGALATLATSYSDFLTTTAPDHEIVFETFRIRQGSVFLRGQKVAAAGAIPASDVSEIREDATSEGSTRGAVLGAVAGFAGGMFFLAANMETRCQPNCSYITMAPLYMTAGGGALGYFGFAKRSDGVIFRR
jgi:hypothetical protein